MSTETRPAEKLAEDQEKAAEPTKEPESEDQFHPHRHGHIAIRPPQTAVTHIDPGVVTFS